MHIILIIEYNMSDDDNVDADLLLSDLERIEKYITSEIVFQRYFRFSINVIM